MGAQRPDRARKALWYGVASSLVVGVIMWYAAFFHGDILAGIFSKDAPVIAAGAEYLKSYAIDCLLVAFLFCFIGYFNGCGKTTFVMVQGIVGAIGIRLPVSWLMSNIVPVSLFRVGLATPASSLVQIILCTLYFLWMHRRQKFTKI